MCKKWLRPAESTYAERLYRPIRTIKNFESSICVDSKLQLQAIIKFSQNYYMFLK